MSKQQHTDALLDGFNPPIFPEGPIAMLRRAEMNTGTTNGLKLEKVGRRIEGFKGMRRPVTSDGYSWFWSLDFAIGEGEIAILFPWAQDFGAADGDQADRSIAIYTKGSVTNDDALALAMKVHEAMYQVGSETPAANVIDGEIMGGMLGSGDPIEIEPSETS